MKKIVSFLLSFLFCITSVGEVLADTNTAVTETTDTSTSSGDYTLQTQVDDSTTKAVNKYFDLTLTQDLQSPLDKSITYTLTVVPHLDSAKTQMIWNNSSSSLTVTPRTKGFVSMTAEQTYTYKAVVKPTTSGTFTISVSVISWQYDTNYTNSVENTLVLNSGLVSQPMGTAYLILLVVEVLVIIGILLFAGWGIKKLVKRYRKAAKDWLTPPR